MTDDDQDNLAGDNLPGERVAKALARAGVASRREVERFIEAGRVALNGEVLKTPAVRVMPGDILTVDKKVVDEAEAARVWRYNKPVGLVTSHSDPKDRPTVFANLPKHLPRVISVGRLDFNTEGLLLLTNDGELARALELPATGIIRRYRARARGRVTQERLDKLKDGITVEGVRYGAIEATLDKAKEGPTSANLWLTLTLSEGKNREVRRVLEALGLTVNRLIRLSYGPFSLGDLASGAVEEVGPRVIREQLGAYIPESRQPKGNATGPVVGEYESRTPQGRRAPRSADRAEAPKKVYKAGWAKAKIKPRTTKPSTSKKPHSAKPEAPKSEGKRWYPAPPAANAPAPDKAWGDKPRNEKARGDKARGDKANSERSGGDKPWDGKPRADRPKGARPTDERPKGARPSTGRPTGAKGPRLIDKPRGGGPRR